MTTKKNNIPPMLALALSMTGCEFIGPQLHQKIPLTDNTPAQEDSLLLPELANDTSKSAENRATKVELFPSGEASIAPQPSHHTGGKSSGKGEYSLNFDDADLGEVAKVILGDILGKNYTISPQVVGKVTLQTSKPLSKDELIPTLDMLLSLNNAALTEQAGMYLIKPSNEALYSSSISTLPGARMPNGYQTRVVPVKNVAATELAEILKPLMPEKSVLHVDPARNLILIAGSGAEISRALDVVNTFDVDILKGRSFALFTPANVSAGKIIEELEQIFNTKKAKDDEASFFRFIEIERLNAVLAITHQANYLRDIENWVLRLDRINTAAAGGVNVYRAQHVSASDLAETLSSIFGSGGSGKSGKASIASGRKSLSATNKKSDGTSSNSGNSGSRQDGMSDRTLSDRNKDKNSSGSGAIGGSLSGSAGGSNSNDMPNVKIISDDGNNALIIVATAQEYAVIERVLKQLDVLPLQVLIEATIVEVQLTNDLQYGIEWYLNKGHSAISGGKVGTSTDTDAVNFTNIATGVATGGFSYAFASKNINAILHAEATKDNINVISSPSLMVLNNQEASIKVGDSVPVQTGSVTSGVTSNPGVTSSIQMMDTGVNLALRPRVNSGGLVVMDIVQSSNNVVPTSVATLNPTISKREIETSVVVQSGETVVLGGMIKDENNYNRFGFPLLHEIPLIGPLFGSTTRKKEKTELVVLLTPRVVNSRRDAQDVTQEFKRKLSGIYQEPIQVEVEALQ